MSSNTVFLVLSASSAKAEGADVGSAKSISKYKKGMAFILNATAESGTDPVADVDIEVLDELSDEWVVLFSFTQVTGDVTERIEHDIVPEGQIRAAWVIAGTATPTVTFSVSMSGKT